jgi:hypothetical protein
MQDHDEHSRRRLARCRPAIALLTAGLLVGACDAGTASTSPPSSEPAQETSAMESTPPAGIGSVQCGQQFEPPGGGGPTLTSTFPASVTPTQPELSGRVELTSAEELRGVTPPGADVFVVRDGRVVGLPLPQDSVGMLLDLGPGASTSVPARVSLTSCESGRPLEAGRYELYARLAVAPYGGAALEAVGGPWPLDVV